MRSCARLLPLVAVFLLLSGCMEFGDWGPTDAYKEDFHSTHPLNPGGTVSIETFNGPIEVIGWEQNSVEVNGTKYASTQPAVDRIKIDVNATPGAVRIRAIRPSDMHWHVGARFTVRIPHKAVLERISTSNGQIRVEEVEGNAHLETSNGAIRLSRIRGNVDGRTSNGTIEAQDVQGDVRFRTSNGTIRAETSNGSFEGVTSNGRIEARLKDPARSWPVRAESSNGTIDLTVDAKTIPGIRASTSNSSILVRVPPGVNARVSAHTSHGSVSSDFDELQSERSERRHNDLSGTLGSGGPLIDLSSSNGSIKILKL